MDSSVILRFLLTKDPSFKKTAQFEKVGSSELLMIECSRVMERYRLENLITDEQLGEVKQNLDEIVEGMFIIQLTSKIKKRAAGSFPTVIGSLDAIHLSTAILWDEYDEDQELVIFTFDRQMRTCALAMSIKQLDPL